MQVKISVFLGWFLVFLIVSLSAEPRTALVDKADNSGAHMLAGFWAPLIVQEIHMPFDEPYIRDYLTRFDFDKDGDVDNNYENLLSEDMPSYVYHWVVHGENYDYVGYGLYYVQGPDNTPNDFQVIVLALKPMPDGADHRLVGMLHWDAERNLLVPAAAFQTTKGSPYYFSDENCVGAVGHLLEPVTDLSHDEVDKQPLDLVLDDYGLHSVLYISGKAHQIQTEMLDRGFQKSLHLEFDENSWADWSGRKFRSRDYPGTQRGLHMNYPQFGIVYHYRSKAETLLSKGFKGRGNFWHHWELLGYDLLPLWDTGLVARGEVLPEEQRQAILDKIKAIAGAGESAVQPGERLDPRLFFDPGTLFGTYFGE